MVFICAIILNNFWCSWVCEIWGNFVEIWYFVNIRQVKVVIKKSFRAQVTHVAVVNYRASNFAITLPIVSYSKITLEPLPSSNVKSRNVTDRELSQKVYFKKSNNPSPFLGRTIGPNNFFIPIENSVWFSRKISLNPW